MQTWTNSKRARATWALALTMSVGVGCDGATAEEPHESPSAQLAAVGGTDFVWPPDCQEKYKLVANAGGDPNQVSADSESFREVYFDIPWGKTPVQAVAIRPLIDNPRVVHHVSLSDERNAHLAHWGPGAVAQVLPADVGMVLPLSGKLRLEHHYVNRAPGSRDEHDQSGFEICVARKLRANTAALYPFVAPATAPAHRTVTNTSSCIVHTTSKVRVLGNSPHMHKLGVHAKLELLRASGSVEVLHDGDFSFTSQTDYPLDLTLETGDRIRTTCVYDNPGDRDVAFGPSIDDEMCINFVTYYPMCALHCLSGNAELDALSLSATGCTDQASGGHVHPGGAADAMRP